MSFEDTTLLQTPPHESLPDVTLLASSNDYAVQLARSKDAWYEYTVYDNADGSRTAFLKERPISMQPEPGSEVLPTSLEYNTSLNYLEFRDATTLAELMIGPLGPALSLLGYDAKTELTEDPAVTSIKVDFQTVDSLNQRLHSIRKATGYATRAELFEGINYGMDDMYFAIRRKTLLVSTGIDDEFHDTVNHGPAWLLLPSSTFDKIGTRSYRLFADLKNHASPTAAGYHIARTALNKHFDALEENLELGLLQDISAALAGYKQAILNIEMSLTTILYGSSTALGRIAVHKEAHAILKRTRQLIEIGKSHRTN